MAKFRVKVTGLLVKGGNMAKGNAIVDESQLLASSKDLIKSGHIEAVGFKADVDESDDLSKMTKNELKEYANLNDFEIDDSKTKAEIIEQIISQVSE